MSQLQDWTNKIIRGDCLELMKRLPDNSVDLVVTSPPYNSGQEYESWQSDDEYKTFIHNTAKEVSRILKEDGRVAWNVAPTMTLSKEIKPVGFQNWVLLNNFLKFRDCIIWDQLNSDCDTAWGSYNSPSAPYFRHQTEMIFFWYKSVWKKHTKGISTIPKSKFPRWTLDLWRMIVAKREGHPCPFPLQLVARCIHMLSFKNDLILDPFMGSGTTAVAAKQLNRRFIGFEINQKYVDIANERLKQEVFDL